jgi:hypothetical protein
MEKNSKKNLKLLILAVIIVLVASSVVVAIFVFNIASSGVDHSSGTFIMKVESRTSSRWMFSAQSAQGYSTIFCDLSQEDLNNFSVDSNIVEGEMLLILSQGENSQTIDLSEGKMALSAEDMGLDMFNSGRISMQLKFDNAKNLSVNISWR